MEKSDTKLNLFSNVFYYLGVWLKTFPAGIFFMLISVPIRIFMIYQTILIPKTIILGIETGAEAKPILLSILTAGLLITACKVIIQVLETKLMALGSRPLFHIYSVPVNKKMFELNYQTLISPEVQTKITKVKNIVMTGSSGGPFHFFGLNLSFLLTAIAGAFFFSSGIISIDLILLFIVLVSGTVNLLYGIYTGKYTQKNMEDRGDDEKKESYILTTAEDRRFAKDIRLYKMKDWLIENFEHYHGRVKKFLKAESNVQAGGKILNALMIFIRDVFAYIYLIYQLNAGTIAVSQFVFLIGLVMEFSKWMDAIVLQISNLIIFNSELSQIRIFLNTPDEKTGGELTVNDTSEKPSIEFKNLSFRYSENAAWIFKDFNLKIDAGEKLALVGINGAGKTTLMHLLMGLLEPTEGSVLIDGKNSTDFKKMEYYNLFSPVFQDINIFPETFAANIAGTENINEEKLKDAITSSGLNEMVSSLPNGSQTILVKESNDEAIDLSGGQNQRMLLARALYKNAKINILDEPTAALDPIAESKIYEEYDAMSKEKTSIFISHRLASTKFCDRIILLEHGKIIEEGTHNELMNQNKTYRNMYDVQSKYYRQV
ncbi:ABC transporter ATP-binding protein [Treponema denticola]|uniref:ABC transporter ATP-binding protein n=1 Tax=Treponema denticola TaxID=158 RepID=A0A9Q9BLY7_TREDN|nr:ABC transporter ATP-binding protein [Treponema denticola]UTC91294.1 ABC transporter ATP-binding protein [Treponema denticola]UTC99352.1 ABC transporter ATP-binding protein [Treponema denticola]